MVRFLLLLVLVEVVALFAYFDLCHIYFVLFRQFRVSLFLMYLQAQYSIEDEEIHGFEMLIRWNNSKYYHQSPLHFITVAEHNGMIVKIGEFVIDETMRIAKLLEKYNITLSMNVSPVQLLQSGFVNEIIEKANSIDLRKDSIALEITETYLMENFSLVNEKLINWWYNFI